MIAFEVKDMTCGHCVSTITQAVKALDSRAEVQVDLVTHRVEINASDIPAARWSEVIQGAGYTPVEVLAGARPATAGLAPVRKGCCCG